MLLLEPTVFTDIMPSGTNMYSRELYHKLLFLLMSGKS